MATTFKQLQDRVKSNVIDLPTAIVTAVPRLINSAMRQLQVDHDFKIMEALFQPTTVIATRSLGAVPADFKEYRGEPWFLKNDSTITKVSLANKREDIYSAIDENDSYFPMVILQAVQSDTQGNGDFWVYPLPDGASDYTDGEYRMKIPYWAFLNDLVNDGDTNWFTNRADLYLEYKATAEAFMRNWDAERSVVWEQKAAIEHKQILKLDKLLRLSTGSNTLVPLWKGANSPKLNW